MKFGTDPEYLIVNRLGRPVPAHVAGMPDKDHKIVLHQQMHCPVWESKGFRDGYMVELNIQPNECRQTVTYRVQRAIKRLKRLIAPKYQLVAVPAVRINLKSMATAPADVRQFGCEPSYDAYTHAAKVPPIDALSHPYRYAGGHLHFGYTGATYDFYDDTVSESWMLNKDNHPQYIKMLDLYLGVPLTYLFDSKETFLRRRYYGQAGEYRSQHYDKTQKRAVGVEYRTPGPEVWNTPWVASFAMGVGRYVGHHFTRLAKQWDSKIEDDLRLAINTGVGLGKVLKRASLPKYPEYPLDFRPLKAPAPRKLTLDKATENAIAAGFYEWADRYMPGKGVLPEDVRD